MGKLKDITIDNISLLDLVYPIGSVYLSFNWKSPADTLGGEWESIVGTSAANDEKRFLLMTNPGIQSGANNESGATGGEQVHQLTVAEMPSHNHSIGYRTDTNITLGSTGNWTVDPGTVKAIANTNCIGNRGGNEAHNNMPPYIQVYGWKRIS